jgi:hypothetical protein
MTTIVKEAIMLAIQASKHSKGQGLVGYLTTVADTRMDLMVGLVGRLLPMQVNAKSETTEPVVYRTTAEVREALLKRGLPPAKVDLIMGKTPSNVISGTFTRQDDNDVLAQAQLDQ